MRFFLIVFIFLVSCSSSKRVFICGDHECINKDEAKLFFEENLSIEVKIIDNQKEDYFNLVKLNTENKDENNSNIKIIKKKNTKNIKRLDKNEIREKKRELKSKIKKVKKNKKDKSNKDILDSKKTVSKKINTNEKTSLVYKKKNLNNNICNIIKNCNIDEISKYLMNKGKNKNYPNISLAN